MFGIGWSEFLVIVCIVIIFIRPKDLPAILKKVGKAYGQLKRMYKDIVSVKDQFVKEMNAAASENAPAQDVDSERDHSKTPNDSNEQNLSIALSGTTDKDVSGDASASVSGNEPLYNEDQEEQI